MIIMLGEAAAIAILGVFLPSGLPVFPAVLLVPIASALLIIPFLFVVLHIRMRRLAEAMDRVSQGFFDTRLGGRQSKDELGRMHSAFNESLSHIEETFHSMTSRVQELKNAEHEMWNMNSELERRVRERTGQFEAANRELEAFIYSVSHDLRAPLRSIDGFSSALEEEYADVMDVVGRDYLRRVRAACSRMSVLIDDLLKLSRLTQGDLVLGEVNLSKMVGKICQQLRQSDLSRNAEFEIESDVIAVADSRLIQVVLENLLGNAWKYTKHKVQAHIGFGVIRKGEEDCFFVRDNGAGFDMKEADRLFQKFQRLHLESDFEGSGIGLTTVRRIVFRHGGRVWAEGKENEGATFYFTLGPPGSGKA
ncbi:HAMP domain-containing protein [bacterium]|nr:HAMP domain-containing protein [bacterium]